MNPDYFGGRSLADTLSTLVHEMVHVWQHYAPVKKCRGGYHDRVWGAKMEEVGLMPSNTGLPGPVGAKLQNATSGFNDLYQKRFVQYLTLRQAGPLHC